MIVSSDFLEYVLDQLMDWGEVTVRRMFGGAGLYRDGMMFALVADDVVYLKVDDKTRDKYIEAGSKPLQPFPDRPVLLSYYEIPPDVLECPDEFIEWADDSLAVQKKRK